jgi:putative ABC transport system substrate-binding protein
MLRVGTASPNPRAFTFRVAFDQRMRELGYIEGQNLVFEFIDTRDRIDRISEGIQELVRRKVDVIIESSGNEQGLKMALATTNTLPIVIIAIQYDPVALGYVSSLARPTGNVTGIYLRRRELVEVRCSLPSPLW